MEVWIVSDYQVRGVFATLEAAKSMFDKQRAQFLEDDEGVVRVRLYDEAFSSYSISKHKVLS